MSQERQEDSLMHRTVDAIAGFSGTLQFLLLNATVFAVWIIVNTVFPVHFRYDPYPFNFLTMSVSLEAIFLSIFVLISQNRASERDKIHAEQERDRQAQQLQENTDLNREEERQEVEILTVLAQVMQGQELQRGLLEKLLPGETSL